MYYLLTESFKSQEATIVSFILDAVPAESIFMLGSSLNQQRIESVFMPDAPSCRNAGHYWLLVLVPKNCGLSDHGVQDTIENGCRHVVPVTVIVLDVEKFHTWLQEGHRFARTVFERAVRLYDSNSIPWPVPAAVNITAQQATESYCTQCSNRINEFIAGAELYQLRQQPKMAAFMLHQAAEQILLAMFKKATGMHISSHNIDKLLRYCAMVNYKIPALFAKNSEANTRLLRLLQEAYIGARYKEDFTISGADLAKLAVKVNDLLELLQEADKVK